MLGHFFHKTCNGVTYLDLSNHFRIITTYGFSLNGITPGLGDIKPKDSILHAEFLCGSCGKNITIEEMVGFCSMCGKEKTMHELFIGKGVGGVYCKSCLEEKEIKDYSDLSAISRKVLYG